MTDAVGTEAPRCSYCGAKLEVVFVHGHGQCANCGTNVDPCCSGADPGSEALAPGERAQPVDASVLKRVFAELGGIDATVTEASFLFALARALDAPLDEARAVMDAAVGLGMLRARDGTLRAVRKQA